MAKHSVEVDSRRMMRELSKVCGVPDGRFRRMVLVLDIDAAPQLFTEGLVAERADLTTLAGPEKVEVEERAVEVGIVGPSIIVNPKVPITNSLGEEIEVTPEMCDLIKSKLDEIVAKKSWSDFK